MSCIDYTMHPEVIALCTQCTRASCPSGMCDMLRNKIAEIRGVPIVQLKKKKPAGNSHPKNVTLYEIDGEAHSIPEWCKIKGVNDNTVYSRMSKGYKFEDALLLPRLKSSRKPKLHEIDGEVHTLQEWCKIKKINYKTVVSRMFKGQTLESALNTPVDGMHKRKNRTLEDA